MGCEFTAVCMRCGHRFVARQGGGFVFHLLHCDKCGKEKMILFRDLGEIHLRYLKSLDPSIATSLCKDYGLTAEIDSLEPIGEDEYLAAVEQYAGYCECGGRFLFAAPIRCPRCGSDQFREDASGKQVFYG